MTVRNTVKNDRGFTLVEISIVLIIIGLILGAAVKGKDLIQSAKQKKFYSNFVKQWGVTVLNYYDRTGGVLGDGVANGGTAATADGNFDNINTAGEWTTVINRLNAVGIEIPTTNTTLSYKYAFKGTVSGPRTIALRLYRRNVTISGGGTVGNNVLDFAQMPTDLAIALDNVIDGSADGTAGNFRQVSGAAWPNVTATTTVTAMYILDVP